MFIIFGFDNYYPSGGVNDCIKVFSEKQDAFDFVEEIKLGKAKDDSGYRVYPSDHLEIAEVTENDLRVVFYTSYKHVRVFAMGVKAYVKLWVDGEVITDSDEECCTAYGTRYCHCVAYAPHRLET